MKNETASRTKYNRDYGRKRRQEEKKIYKRYDLVLPISLGKKIEDMALEKQVSKKEMYILLLQEGLNRIIIKKNISPPY